MAARWKPSARWKPKLGALRPKPTQKKFAVCPKCAYSSDVSARKPGHLPAGINPMLLLENSPTPQLLLSESNVVVYANRSAERILRVKQLEVPVERTQTTVQGSLPEGAPRKPTRSMTVHVEGEQVFADADDYAEKEPEAEKGRAGLVGRTIDQLNIDLTEEDMRRWVSLIAVYTNVKLSLGKLDTKRKEKSEHAEDDMYGESSKWNHDYYGDLEKARQSNSVHADNTLRETLPICITRLDGTTVNAVMYVSLIDPYATGYSYSSISIVPDAARQDATFTKQVVVPDQEHQEHHYASGLYQAAQRTRRRRKKPADPENVAGSTGRDFIKRVRCMKDLILDEMEYCFMALSPDGDIVITNKATKAVLGAEMLEASMGEGFEWIARLNIWRPDFSEPLPFHEWALNRLLTERKSLTQTIGLWAGDIPLTVELRGKCIYENPEKEEGLIAALAMVVDQTAWAAKEKNLRSLQAMQEAFMTNVSRNLKTPLSAMIGLLEFLHQHGKLDADQMDSVRQLFGSINSLLLVVNDVVDFLSVQDGQLSVQRNVFVLQDLVDDIRILFEQSMAKEGIGFQTDFTGIDKSHFGDGTRLVLLGDDGKIRRIIIGLLSNAFKFTSKGNVTFRVLTQKLQRNSLEVRFEIIDEGIGISKADQERIFMPFEQSYQTNQTVVGFGLNIAKKFTSILAGDIGVESSPGKGSTFWLVVPCGRPSPDASVKVPPHEQLLAKQMGLVMTPERTADSSQQAADPEPELHIEGTRILLVEDNWTHQLVMQKHLQRLGCQVVSAVNGQDALDILRKPETDVDMVFTDLQMPLLDGFETTKLIRTDPEYARHRTVPVVGVTATESKVQRDKAGKFGLDEFMVKPLTNAALKRVIVRMMDPIARALRRKETEKRM